MHGSRRGFLRNAAALLGLGATASLSGCTGSTTPSGTDPSSGDDPRVGWIPSEATAVAYVDVAGLLNDDRFVSTVNGLVRDVNESGAAGDLPTLQKGLDRIERRTGVDPRKVNEVLGFATGGGESGAFVAWTDLPEETVTAPIVADPTKRTYKGTTVYESGVFWLAVLGDGRYAAGRPSAVRSVVDLRAGDADPVGGTLRTAYTAAEGDLARFAVDYRALPSGSAPATVRKVRYAYGSLGASGSGLELSVSARVEDEATARQFVSLVEVGKTRLRSRIGAADLPPRIAERLRRVVDATSASRNGRTVTVTNDRGTTAAALLFGAVVGSFVLGLGENPEPLPPNISFAFSQEGTEVTITHRGGDTTPASQLFVSGEELARTGSWAELGGDASGEWNGQPAVVAGDSLTVEAASGSTVRVVWRSPDGEKAQVLASYEVR